jgi:hypothetical protein
VRCHIKSVEFTLPVSVQLKSHFHTAKDHLLAALEVYPQLHNVTIVDREGFGLGTGRAQSDVVEKCARAALHVLNEPLAILVPELTVPPTDDLALKSYGRG